MWSMIQSDKRSPCSLISSHYDVFRMEQFDIFKPGTHAKIGGTLVAFAGATFMTLYKGIAVITTHTKSSHQTAATSKSSTDADWIKGSLVLIVAYSSLAAFYILQVVF